MRSRFRPHLPGLDGVRGLAILIVVIHNVGYFEERVDSFGLRLIREICGAGWVGVTLFFVLSGFLITRILLQTRSDPHYFRSFYIRRALRIFPLSFLTLAGAFLVLPHVVDLGEWGQRAHDVQVWYWTYLMNWTDPYLGTLPGLSHFWSLAVEEQFYLFWPMVVLALTSRRLAGACATLVVSALVIRLLMVLHWHAPVDAIYNFTVTRWDALGWGALIAVCAADDDWYRSLVRGLRISSVLAAVFLVAMIWIDHGLSWASPASQTLGYSALAVLFAQLIVIVIDPGQPDAIVRRIAGATWLRWFGKYSYGLYVVHWPIHRFGQVLLTKWVVLNTPAERVEHLLLYIGLNLAASTAVAVGVWHLVERRALALKDVWAPRSASA